MKMVTRKEVAGMYGIHPNTLRAKIKAFDFDIESKGLLNPKDLKRIFEELGEPPLPKHLEKNGISAT